MKGFDRKSDSFFMELEPRIKDRPQSHIDEKIERWSKSKGELISTWKVLSS